MWKQCYLSIGPDFYHYRSLLEMLTCIKMSFRCLLHLMFFFLSVTSNQPDVCVECMRVSEWPLGSLSILLLKSYCLKYIKRPHQAMTISTACLVTTSNIYRLVIYCFKTFGALIFHSSRRSLQLLLSLRPSVMYLFVL